MLKMIGVGRRNRHSFCLAALDQHDQFFGGLDIA